MSHIEWIVCERTSRWASALRMALASGDMPHRLCELRHLAELDAELASRPTAVVAIEVHRGNFADLLVWLPRARQQHTGARFVGLVDRSIADSESDVGDALVEAGASLVVASPRRLDALLRLGERHALIPRKIAGDGPPIERVWASLPWQAG